MVVTHDVVCGASFHEVDKQIIKFIKQHPGKRGIIYCISRKKVEELAAVLKANDIKAAAYHSDIQCASSMA